MPKKRVLITGAAGRIAPNLIRGLAGTYELRLLDIAPITDEPDAIQADITDLDALCQAMDGASAVVHLAAHAWDGDFHDLLMPANVAGVYNIYEAARHCGVKRVVFASTYHVVESYGPFVQGRRVWLEDEPAASVIPPISTTAPFRPDSMYAVTKAFGEVVAQYYADYHGVTSVCLRLGAVAPKKPQSLASPRTWASWLSAGDFCQLVARSIEADVPGCITVYGISRNTRRLYDLEPGRRLLGYEPEDDSELHLAAWHRAGVVPPAPPPGIPYGQRLPELIVHPGQAAVCWVGQACFYVKTPDTSLFIDPFVTVWHDTLLLPLLKPHELQADFVLLTHHHRDHLDRHALPVAAQTWPALRFVGPPSCCDRLARYGIGAERLVALAPGQRLRSGETEITAIGARHSTDTLDAVGYVVSTPGVAIYHTGDTEYDPVLHSAGRYAPHIMFVPINGRGGNMTAEQAAQLAGDLKAPAVVPMHFGTLQPRADLLDRFLAALAVSAPSTTAAVMEDGAFLYLPLNTKKGMAQDE
jgi:uronate dehydrogenase